MCLTEPLFTIHKKCFYTGNRSGTSYEPQNSWQFFEIFGKIIKFSPWEPFDKRKFHGFPLTHGPDGVSQDHFEEFSRECVLQNRCLLSIKSVFTPGINLEHRTSPGIPDKFSKISENHKISWIFLIASIRLDKLFWRYFQHFGRFLTRQVLFEMVAH